MAPPKKTIYRLLFFPWPMQCILTEIHVSNFQVTALSRRSPNLQQDPGVLLQSAGAQRLEQRAAGGSHLRSLNIIYMIYVFSHYKYIVIYYMYVFFISEVYVRWSRFQVTYDKAMSIRPGLEPRKVCFA